MKSPIYYSRRFSRVEVDSPCISKRVQQSFLQHGKPKDLDIQLELQIVWANYRESYLM
jgi:hypothetical protein